MVSEYSENIVFGHHSFYDDDLGAELLMNGKDVNQAQSEHHEIYSQDRPSCLIGVVHHPAKTKRIFLISSAPLFLVIIFIFLWYLPAWNPNNKKWDGNHVTLVPVVLHIEFKLLQDVHLFISEETLS